MAKQEVCTFLYGVHGLLGPQIPIWADDDGTIAITAAVTSGLSVSNEQTPANEHEGTFALLRTLERLMQDGTVPPFFPEVGDISPAEYARHGFEDHAAWEHNPSLSLQGEGSPPFKELDVSWVLFLLRRASRCQELRQGSKLAFQLGILTYTINGKEIRHQAQVFPAAKGKATHTVWLYRWCIFRSNYEYEEHWRAFMAPSSREIAVPIEDTAVLVARPAPVAPKPLKTPRKTPQAAYQTPPATRKRKQPDNESASPAAPGVTIAPVSNTPTPTPARPTKALKATHYSNFDHSGMTHEQLLAADPALLQGDALLRLLFHHSNKGLHSAINSHHERDVIKDPNVITKRLKESYKIEAARTGKTVNEIKDRLKAGRDANGVKHKMKINTDAYRRKSRRGNGGGEV